jgi:dephospho-CoA kinase
MKVLIIGYARHGKDTLAEIFQKNFNIKFYSASKLAAELFLFDILKDKYGYVTVEDCFNDRVNHRQEWYELIKDYHKDDLTKLTRKLIETKSDIYVGIRNNKELIASKKLFDIVIWVDASKRLQYESKDSCNIDKSYADIIIENNFDLEDFKIKALKLGEILFKK